MNALGRALRANLGAEATLEERNAVWLALDIEPESRFLDTPSSNYDTGTYRVDFLGDPEGSRRSINSWASDNTRGLIDELFSPGDIEPETELVLPNTKYFAATWATPFAAGLTDDVSFTLASGATTTVLLMSGVQGLPVASGSDWTAAALAGTGGDGGGRRVR